MADEISVQCLSCSEGVSVDSKVDHQRHHKALKTLKYRQVDKNVLSVESLLRRRKQLIKKLVTKYEGTEAGHVLDKRINTVNEAFDVARSDVVRGKSVRSVLYPLIERVRAKDGGLCFSDKELHYDVKSSPVWGDRPRCVGSMGTSYAKNIHHRDVMEDRMTTYPQFISLDSRKGRKPSSFFVGMYDGHRGQQASELTQVYLHHFIREEMERERSPSFNDSTLSIPTKEESDTIIRSLQGGLMTHHSESKISHSSGTTLSSESILRGCKRAYKRMDDFLSWGINETSRVRWSSCSLATCIINDEDVITQPELATEANYPLKKGPPALGRLYVANAGSVEAYLCHNNKPFSLTQRHTTQNEEECRRIGKLGGRIARYGKNILVNGIVSTTRALGNHGDVPLRRCVTSDPYTSTARLTKNSQFMVMATESVWSVFDIEEVFELVKTTEKHVDSLKNTLSSISTLWNPSSTTYQESPSQMKHGVTSRNDDMNDSDECLQTKIEEVVVVLPADEEEEDLEGSMSRIFDSADPRVSRAIDGGSGKTLPAPTIPSSTNYQDWLAAAMSNRIVQAAIKAGATDNVSALVVLFQGYFR